MDVPPSTHRTTAGDLMTSPPITVRRHGTYKEIVDLLLLHDISGVPVVDPHGRVIGVVTEADLLPKQASVGVDRARWLALATEPGGRFRGWLEKTEGMTAVDLMSRPAVTVAAEEDVHAVARTLLRRGLRSLPVVDRDGKLLGVIARRDVLSIFDRSDEEIARDVSEALTIPGFLPSDVMHVSIQEGVAYVGGAVPHGDDIAAVVELIRNVDGVVDVVHRLRGRDAAGRKEAS